MNQGGHTMRLHSIDFLRGLALTIVLIDHVDYLVGPSGFLRNWTLMGLGFSDAAETFVFLTGFTFGWAYSPRIAEDGFLTCQKRVLVRTLQIYGSYLATVAIITTLEYFLRTSSLSLHPAVAIDDATTHRDVLFSAMRMMHQPFALGILCMYAVVLPFLPLSLALHRIWWGVPVELSLLIYLCIQIYNGFNLNTDQGGGWFFNPFAWQFLLVLGMTCGCRARSDRRVLPFTAVFAVPALLILFCGVLAKKHGSFLSGRLGELHTWPDIALPTLASKTSLGPLRILHFLALAYIITAIVSRANGSVWRHPLAIPFIVCGRHPLFAYCVGTVLAYLSMIIFRWVRATPFNLIIICIFLCICQFCIMYIFDFIKNNKESNK